MLEASVHSPIRVINVPQSESYGGRLRVVAGSGGTIINSTGYSTVWCRTTSNVLICYRVGGTTSIPPRAQITPSGTIRFNVGRALTETTYTWFVFAGGTTLGPA